MTTSIRTVRDTGMRVWRWSRTSGTQPRLVLALKAAIAAAIAWLVAQNVPGAAADYPYYAPLGAVTAMQSTLFSSLRSGVQTLIGIVVGVLIAGTTIWVGYPGVVAIAVAVGVGVLIGGLRVLGEGGSWAPTAAVLVILVGGSHAEGYSFGYVVQTAVGIVIGLAMNFLVFPPLYFWHAERGITQTNDVLARHLEDLAADLRSGERDDAAWDARQRTLDRAMAEVRERVSAAEESRRGNPRGMRGRSRRQLAADARRFRALERATWYTTDLTEIVGRSGPLAAQLGRPDRAFADRLAAAVSTVADVVRGEGADPQGAALDAIRAVERAMDEQADGRPSRVSLTSAATVALRGIVESERQATSDEERPNDERTPREQSEDDVRIPDDVAEGDPDGIADEDPDDAPR